MAQHPASFERTSFSFVGLVRTALFVALAAGLIAVAGCARPGTGPDRDGGGGGFDAGPRDDTGVGTTVCGPAGQACCAGSTCELGLRCARGTCCIQPGSTTRCNAAADCCGGLQCQSGVCCAGRSSTCSGSADCCNGLVCSGGVCLSPDSGDLPGMMGCGGAGGTCCAGFTCRSGLVCNSMTGMCEGCGDMGQHCCDGATPCLNTSLACNPMTGNCETAPDPATRCGRLDGPCCPEATGGAPVNCEGGLVCTGGTCSDASDTGGMGQPCNPRGTCDADLICDHTSNTCAPTPMDCGRDMMMCCDTGAAAQSCSGSLHCQFGQCSTCAGPSLTCVLGGLLPGQQCCNGSVCRPAPLLPRCCVGQGEACTNSLDCCGFMQCMGGTCQAGRMGSFCIDSSECGDGLVCHNFTCQMDTMAMCTMPGASCMANGECCDGYTCGVQHNAPVTMAPTQCCTGHDGACASDDECCGNMACNNGACVCRMMDETCFRDSECCDSSDPAITLGCVAGACQNIQNCRRPGSSVTTCTGRADCCQGLSCLVGHMGGTQTVCCEEGGSPCEHDTDCCGTMSCTMGRCTCRAVGETCSNDIDCCGSAFCVSGHCSTM
jgi:hypothetical protein